MHSFSQVPGWITSHWSGPDGVSARLVQHIELSFVSLAIALLIAVPVGLWVGHRRRFEFLAVSTANIGRAIPSFAVLVLVFVFMVNVLPAWIAFGPGPTVVALTLLAIPPILTNTYVGVQSVDRETVEAARGMGLREREVLAQLEVPLAAPLMMAGIRTAALQVIATATLAALVAGGGLGRFIVDGNAQQDYPQAISGALLVAALALVVEGLLALVERAVTPRTSSGGGGSR
jgi:osmoprotectant transport system permease protein